MFLEQISSNAPEVIFFKDYMKIVGIVNSLFALFNFHYCEDLNSKIYTVIKSKVLGFCYE